MKNNTQVQNAPDQLTDEQKKQQYKEFTAELLTSMQDLKLIKTAYTLVHRLFLRDTGATLDISPQAKRERQLLADINHYCGNMPIEQLTHIRNICYYIYNNQ